MAEEQDDSQKTEDPTPKRLEETRKKGQVPNSREVASWFMILAFTLLVFTLIESVAVDLSRAMRGFLENGYDVSLDQGNLIDVLANTAIDVGMALILALSLPLAAALAASLLQFGFLWAPESIAPKLEKISPISGMKRLFSMRSVTEFIKGIVKISIVGVVATVIMYPEVENVTAFLDMDLISLVQEIVRLGGMMLVVVLMMVTIIAGIDLIYQRYEHMKKLKMSRQEIKDEFKQTEGDPVVKNRIRQIRTERARKRMMAQVPQSDVVVTNPTHFAVALSYDPTSNSAPRMTAKGADLVAKRIRDLANDNDIPIVENPPLARALYAGCEVDDEIPADHYQAVAEVIGYVYRLKGKKMPEEPQE